MKSRGTPLQEDLSKPVAYDQYGRPLYAHPPTQPAQPVPHIRTQQDASLSNTSAPSDAIGPPQVVYMTRAIDPHQQEISPEIKAKHDESVRRFPHLNLSEGEFVINAIKRHPIGLISIWGMVLLSVVLILFLSVLLASIKSLPISLSGSALVQGGIIALLLIILVVLCGVVATFVYEANRFYLTNESVMQHIQTSLFSKKDQTISLGNIEDASYRQHGILQTILNYGSIRLSTEGEETTYRFNFVSNPQEQIKLLNDAVEAFKNFRPVSDIENS